jgi:hypothetical protein
MPWQVDAEVHDGLRDLRAEPLMMQSAPISGSR